MRFAASCGRVGRGDRQQSEQATGNRKQETGNDQWQIRHCALPVASCLFPVACSDQYNAMPAVNVAAGDVVPLLAKNASFPPARSVSAMRLVTCNSASTPPPIAFPHSTSPEPSAVDAIAAAPMLK